MEVGREREKDGGREREREKDGGREREEKIEQNQFLKVIKELYKNESHNN